MERFQKLEKRSTEIILLTVLVLLAAGGITASTVLNSGSSSDLVAEYRFDTGAGDTAYDTAGNNDGTINGANWTEGVEGKAMRFDGSDDYVDISNSNSLSSLDSSVTISGWIKPQVISEDWDNIFHKNNAIFFGLDTNNGLKWGIRQDGSTFNSVTVQNVVDTNRFQHVTATFDSGNYRIFVDGRKVKEGTFSSVTSIQDTSSGAEWGRQNDNRYFDGKMDGMRIYSKSLNHSQIHSLYNRGSWRTRTTAEEDSSKVLDISFQHRNSSHVLDTSGEENHGQPQNGARQKNAWSCKVGRCYSFDGNDDRVEISDSPELRFGESGEEMTVMFWINPQNTSAEVGIMQKENEYEINHENNGEIWLRTWGGNNGGTDQVLKEDEWQHVTVTWTPGSGGKVFYNGAQIQNFSDSDNSAETTNPVEIGRSAWGTTDSKIDQFKVFNRSLTQKEIIEKTQGLSSNGAVLDMRFNRDGGDRVIDHSKENNHGTLQPNASSGPKWKKGLEGNALKFDGDDDAVNIPDSSSLDLTDEITVSAWVKLLSGNDDYNSVLFKDWSSWVTRIESNDRFMFKIGSTDSIELETSSLSIGKWHHVVATYNGSKMKVYVDGDVENTHITSGSIGTGNNDVKIGGYGYDATNERKFMIDSPKVLPYAISNSKVKQLYTQGKSNIGTTSNSSSTEVQDGLVLSQTFDRVETCGQSDTISCPSGMSGEVAVDESSKANHGETVRNPEKTNSAECKSGSCLEFDATRNMNSTDDTEVNMGDVFNFSNGESFSLSAWAKPSRIHPDTAYKDGSPTSAQIPLLSRGSGCGGYGLLYHVNKSDYITSAKMQLRGYTCGQVDQANYNAGEELRGEWHHLTGVYDGSKQELKLYLNGEKVASSSVSSDTNFSNPKDFGVSKGWIANDGRSFDGLLDQARVYNRSLSDQEVWKLYTQGRDRENGMAGPVGHWRISSESSPLPDVSGEGNHGDLNLLGESGTFNTSDGEWKEIKFDRSYADPVVIGTTNTYNGEPALSFEARNVQSNRAEMRVCESEAENAEGCDTHGTEKAGYMVINAKATKDIPGIEAGSFEIDGNLDSNKKTISYSESFTNDPYVMANVNSDNGNNPVEARVTSYSNTSFTAGICYQDSSNGCEDHPFEKVGWVAVEPGNIPFKQKFAVGSTGPNVGNSNWYLQSFGTTFTETPVVTAMTLTENGGQGLLIDEARNINTTHAEVRYCEAENGDSCNGHNNEEVAWFAAEEGLLTYTDGNFPRYVDTEKRGKALEFDGSDDSVEVKNDYSHKNATFTAWVKADDLSSGWILNKFADKGDGWGMKAGSGRILIYDDIDGVDNTYYQTDLDNSWHHIAISMKGNENHLYVDGKKEGSGETSSSTLSSFSGNLYLAQRGADGSYFDGKLDDIRVYPYALNQQQVKRVMNNGGAGIGG